ncbi:MAG: uroporphyrinogen decarboxylase family protein [Armatimonadota bacterium]
MTSRERVINTLNHHPVDRAPRNLWALAGVRDHRQDEVAGLQERFPMDFAPPTHSYGAAKRARGVPCEVGEYTDEWGCVWHVGERGVIGEVKECPLTKWPSLDHYELPWEILDNADFSEVNKSCAESDLFMIAGTHVRPFERMQFLRGTENLFMDLAYGVPEVYRLRDMLHEFFLKNIYMWAKTDVDGIVFLDDWGSQTSLLISPVQWREFFKPLYKDYCDMIHSAGKKAFFHSDGQISSIYPDLIEIGVDAVNSQLFCMDIEELGKNYGGKITFWGEIDRQNVLPFGTTEDVRAAVRRVRAALDKGKGGVIAQCEWGLDTPVENVAAVFDEWSKA